MSEADVTAIVGFAVTKAANNRPDSCKYVGADESGSVDVAVFKYESESQANLDRDSSLLPKIPGVSGAFFNTERDTVLWRGDTQVAIHLDTPEGVSDSQAQDALVALTKKFA